MAPVRGHYLYLVMGGLVHLWYSKAKRLIYMFF